MDEQKIKRINELYRKSKAEGLSSAEAEEQRLLRLEYLAAVRRNLQAQLDQDVYKRQEHRYSCQ